ncbi:sulfatase-like hydrolase/transferase [Flavobacteriaceae bacterium]|nr:sulfatase-like hydrolase/transferase [Flavobacteriaceae bacterium]
MVKKILSICLLASLASTQVQAQDPNIVFFLVDDLGYMDINCYVEDHVADGYKQIYETPHIDALADEGVRFTNGYEAAPRCAASRTSIMTGKFEARADSREFAGQTLWSEALKADGYKTMFIGKWHLGHDDTEYPDDYGFDINLAGADNGSPESFWFPYDGGTTANGLLEAVIDGVDTPARALSTSRHANFLGENGVAGAAPASGQEDEYLTDRITWEVEDFIEDHVAENTANGTSVPFMALVSHYAVHVPLEAKATETAAAQVDIDAANFPDPTLAAGGFVQDLTTETKLYPDVAVYAAMVKSMDESLGAIVAKLKAEGVYDNTIIIVTSDNGGLSTNEHGSTRERSTSNKPLRGGKTWLFEGGIRLPIIIAGPNYRSGIVEDTPIVGTDFYPTLMDMAGITTIKDLDNVTVDPAVQYPDGESFEDLLLTAANGGDANFERTNPLVWDFNYSSSGTANVSMAAVRSGDFKLLEFKHTSSFELYNVATDIGETTDLASSNIAKVKELKDMLYSFRSEAGISHRNTNAGFITNNTDFYNAMNTAMGTNVQASVGCAAVANAESFIYNNGFECWYDLDWSLNFSNTGEGTLKDAKLESRTDTAGAHINVTDGAGYGNVQLVNTDFYHDFNGVDLEVGVYAKSPTSNRFKFQIKVRYVDGTTVTYLSDVKTTNATNTYDYYTHIFPTATITSKATEYIEVRIQCGKDMGDYYFDDFYSKAAGEVLSSELVGSERDQVSLYYNDDRNEIVVDGPYVVNKLYVINTNGTIVKKQVADVETVKVGDLNNGVYIVKALLEGNKTITKKLVIN